MLYLTASDVNVSPGFTSYHRVPAGALFETGTAAGPAPARPFDGSPKTASISAAERGFTPCGAPRQQNI